MRLVQYRPAFFEGFTNEEFHCASENEALEADFLKRWAIRRGFYGYEFAPYTDGIKLLSAKYEDGKYPIGFLYDK